MFRDSYDGHRYNPREVVRTKTVFSMPLKYKEVMSSVWVGRPLIFTSSLTDLFHPSIDSYRSEIWDIIRKCPHLIFQILTKRPERVLDCIPEDFHLWDNVWLGTSVGSAKSMDRIRDLMWVKGLGKAKTIFLSLEPLHGPIDLEQEIPLGTIDCGAPILEYVDWVIVGGESGHDTGTYRYRPCNIDWVQDIVDACTDNDVPVFVKQMGTHLSKQMGMSDRHGGNIDEFPHHLQIRQFPEFK